MDSSSSTTPATTISVHSVPNNTDYTVADGITDVLLNCYDFSLTITLPDPALHIGRVIDIINKARGKDSTEGCYLADTGIPATFSVSINIDCVNCGIDGKYVDNHVYPNPAVPSDGSYVLRNSNAAMRFYSNGTPWLGITYD